MDSVRTERLTDGPRSRQFRHPSFQPVGKRSMPLPGPVRTRELPECTTVRDQTRVALQARHCPQFFQAMRYRLRRGTSSSPIATAHT